MNNMKLVTLLMLLQVHLDGIESRHCVPSYVALRVPTLKVGFPVQSKHMEYGMDLELECKAYVEQGFYMEFRLTWRTRTEERYPQDHWRVRITENKTVVHANRCVGQNITARLQVTGSMPIQREPVSCCTITREALEEKCTVSEIVMRCPGDIPIFNITSDFNVYLGQDLRFECVAEATENYTLEVSRTVEKGGFLLTHKVSESEYETQTSNVTHSNKCTSRKTHIKLVETATMVSRGKYLSCCMVLGYGKVCKKSPKFNPMSFNIQAISAPEKAQIMLPHDAHRIKVDGIIFAGGLFMVATIVVLAIYVSYHRLRGKSSRKVKQNFRRF